MTATFETTAASQLFVLENVSWEYYERTLEELQAAHCHVRVTYDDGRMEFMTTGDLHERAKKTIARLIECYALERDIPLTGLGQITCRRKKLRKGLEPDECYYIQTPAPPVSRQSLDLNRYPPPDLAVEVDIESVSIPRQPIYAALGVREVWRFDGRTLAPLHLTPGGNYAPAAKSLAFPDLPFQKLNELLVIAMDESQHVALRSFRDWLRQQP